MLRDLVVEYQEDPTPETARKLLAASIGLRKSILNGINIPSNNQAYDYEDLESETLVGFFKAVSNYDPSKGYAFSTYAYRLIYGGVIDFLRKHDTLTRKYRRLISKLSRRRDELEQKMGGRVSFSSAIEIEGESEYGEIIRSWKSRYSSSLFQEVSSQSTGKSQILIEKLHNPNNEDVESIVTEENLIGSIKDHIDALPNRLRLILTLTYEEEFTLKEIGRILSVTEARISQLKAKALDQVRESMHLI